MRKIEKLSMRIYARIYDDAVLADIDRAVKSGKFASKSDVVGKCVELALPILTGRSAASPQPAKGYDAEKALKQHASLLRELSVQTTMIFNLVVGLFRAKVLELDGMPAVGQDLACGRYEVLFEYYQDRLNELMKML